MRQPPSRQPPPPRELRRVLAVCLDSLSGLLLATPAFEAIRAALPGVQLVLLTSHAGAAAAAHLEMVDETWAYNAPWTHHGGAEVEDARLGRDEAALVDRIAEGSFDAALIFAAPGTSPLPSALLCRMAGIPRRVACCAEPPWGLLTDWVRDAETAAVPRAADHRDDEVRRHLALVVALGLPVADGHQRRLLFTIRDDDRRRVAACLHEAGIGPATPYAVLHTASCGPDGSLPAQHWAAAARVFAGAGCAAVFSGNAVDIALTEAAVQSALAPVEAATPDAPSAPVLSLAGRQSLGELAALIEGAQVLVCGHSVAAQLAAAVGTPVIDAAGSAEATPDRWLAPPRRNRGAGTAALHGAVA